MRETNQTDKLGRSGEPDKQTKIVRRSNRQIRLFVSVCLVTTLLEEVQLGKDLVATITAMDVLRCSMLGRICKFDFTSWSLL